MVVLPVYAFVSLRKLIRWGDVSRRAALVRYAAMVVCPILIYAALFALMFGIDAVWSLDLIAEGGEGGFAMALFLGTLLWLLATSIFALSLLFVDGAGRPASRR